MTSQAPKHSVDLSTSKSYARHKQQRFWQILLPVGFGALVILFVLGLVIWIAVETETGGSVSQWADVSMIWLLLPAWLFAVVIAIFLFGFVALLARLLRILQIHSTKFQHLTNTVSNSLIAGANRLVAPIINVKGFTVKIPALINSLFGRQRK